MTKPTVGYIGLGLMGKPMAMNILKAGFPLIVHNRSRESVDEMVSLGAKPAYSPRETAELADIVFSNLPDTPDVEKVALGEDGIIEGIKAGDIYIDNSTIKPTSAREISERFKEKGAFFLDAPVSGGDIGAINATLTIMVGGNEVGLRKAMPVLESIGKNITHVGDSGAGQIAKAANQIMVSAQMIAMAELLIFAKKAGADPTKIIQAIRGGAAQCWTLDVKPQRLFEGNRSPGFKANMQAKDLNIVIDSAKEFGVPLLFTAVGTQIYSAMLEMGMGDLDNSAVIGVYESLAGVKLVDDAG